MVFDKGIVVAHNKLQRAENIGCPICFTGLAGAKNHVGSPFCEEGSIASGGNGPTANVIHASMPTVLSK